MPSRNLKDIYSLPFVGSGTFGYVFKISDDRVLKIARTFPETDETTEYINWANLEILRNEGAIYRRLGNNHAGIIHCFEILDESIELSFANEGTLLKYIENNPPPTEMVRSDWIRSLADTFAYIHSRRVVVQDIGLRNILIHDKTLKLIDFGQSFLLPIDTDMNQFSMNETTPEIEILHIGFIFYSIAKWKVVKYYYFDLERWPLPDELPDLNGIIYGEIIEKCWTAKYASVEELRNDILELQG